MTKKMKNLRSQSTAEYWQIFNQCDHSYQPNIPFSDLIDISKNLNSSVTDNLNEKKIFLSLNNTESTTIVS